jgi:catechol 2,3-dioxygenase-like lactoylglutathione lyase family enzyme
MAILTWMGLPGDASQWASLGFVVDGGAIRVGSVLCATGREAAWSFDELDGDASLLGVPTSVAARDPGPRVEHPNGVDRIDHVVYTVPNLDEAVGALTAVLGAEPRRRFKPRGEGGPEMAFYRAGDAFIEVVASGRPASLMGVVFMCPDLDACVAAVRTAGGLMGDPKPAVQGGRIASVPRDFGLPYGVAVMDRAPQTTT